MMTLSKTQRAFLQELVETGYSVPPLWRRVAAWHKTAESLQKMGIIQIVRLHNANGWEARLILPVPAGIHGD